MINLYDHVHFKIIDSLLQSLTNIMLKLNIVDIPEPEFEITFSTGRSNYSGIFDRIDLTIKYIISDYKDLSGLRTRVRNFGKEGSAPLHRIQCSYCTGDVESLLYILDEPYKITVYIDGEKGQPLYLNFNVSLPCTLKYMNMDDVYIDIFELISKYSVSPAILALCGEYTLRFNTLGYMTSVCMTDITSNQIHLNIPNDLPPYIHVKKLDTKESCYIDCYGINTEVVVNKTLCRQVTKTDYDFAYLDYYWYKSEFNIESMLSCFTNKAAMAYIFILLLEKPYIFEKYLQDVDYTFLFEDMDKVLSNTMSVNSRISGPINATSMYILSILRGLKIEIGAYTYIFAIVYTGDKCKENYKLLYIIKGPEDIKSWEYSPWFKEVQYKGNTTSYSISNLIRCSTFHLDEMLDIVYKFSICKKKVEPSILKLTSITAYQTLNRENIELDIVELDTDGVHSINTFYKYNTLYYTVYALTDMQKPLLYIQQKGNDIGKNEYPFVRVYGSYTSVFEKGVTQR